MIPEVHILVNDYYYSNDTRGSDIVQVFEDFDEAYDAMCNSSLEFQNDCKIGEHPDFIDFTVDISDRVVTVKSAKDSNVFEKYFIETHLVVQHKNED